jgi:hypothetical protein
MADSSKSKAKASGSRGGACLESSIAVDAFSGNCEKKALTLTIRLTPVQRQMLDAEADRTHRSLSDLAREALFVGLKSGFRPSAAPRLAPVRRRAYVPEDPALISAVQMFGVQAELIQRSIEQCRAAGDIIDMGKVLLVLRSIEHAASRALPPLWRRWEEEYGNEQVIGRKTERPQNPDSSELSNVQGTDATGASTNGDPAC